MSEELLVRHIAATVHGRYLVKEPRRSSSGTRLMVGFHGYAENAEDQMARMERVAAGDVWLLCSIQALHPFYTRADGRIVAGWLTALDLPTAVHDNLQYIGSVRAALNDRYSIRPGMVFCGFSQGATMAYRAAADTDGDVHIIAAAGGIPAEIGADRLGPLTGVLIARGGRDRRYSEEAMLRDSGRLQDAGVRVSTVTFPGIHEWGEGLDPSVRAFLDSLD